MLLRISCFFLSLLCGQLLHAQVDTTIGLVDNKYGTDHYALAAAISFDQKGEREKANAIYNWVTHNIAYDVEFLRKFPKHYDDKAERALKTKKAVCEGYSELFAELCRDAGMQAVTIEGYAKDWIFDNGDEIYIPRHEWSAVKINGKWELVDATWGAGSLYQKRSWLRRWIDKLFHHNKMSVKSLKFRYKYDPQYFMQDPETFRLRHLPSDPLWQLTDSTMPITVFEAGDSAGRKFNELYSKPRQKDERLDRIAKLEEKQKVFEMADRAYAYNRRYPVVQALKNTYRAESMIDKVMTDSTIENPDLVIKDAKNDLKNSMEFIKQQKKTIPEEYNKLKKKNKAKSMEAKQQVRVIKTDDKKLLAECKKHTKSGDTKEGRARKKVGEMQRRKQGLDAGRIDEIATAKVRKKEGSAELYAIKDSATARNTRIATTRKLAAEQSYAARLSIVSSAVLLDSLVESLNFEDSMLRKEAVERLGMHDSYDDEVKKWSGMFKKQKYQTTDTLLKYYFAAFDSIVVKYEKLQTTHIAVLDLYKSNLRGYEQYKKWNNTDASLKPDYTNCIKNYAEAIDSAAGDMGMYISYLEGNKKLFAMLNKLGKRQIRIVEYMEKAEKSRESLEAGSIARKRAFDVKENEKQRAGVQKGLKALDRVINKMDAEK